MIKLGSTEIKKVMLGTTEIKKAMLGSTKIYDSSPPAAAGTYSITLTKANATYIKYVITPNFSRDTSNAILISPQNIDDYMTSHKFDNLAANAPITINGIQCYVTRSDSFGRFTSTTNDTQYVYIIREGKTVAHGPVVINGTNTMLSDVVIARVPQTTLAFMMEHDTATPTIDTGCIIDMLEIWKDETTDGTILLLEQHMGDSFNFINTNGTIKYVSDGANLKNGYNEGFDDFDYFDFELKKTETSSFSIVKLDAPYTLNRIKFTASTTKNAKISIWKWDSWNGTAADMDFLKNADMLDKKYSILPGDIHNIDITL